jgi:Mg2+ and Co2+ transporter CorA
MNYGSTIMPGYGQSLQALEMFGSSKSGPRIDALTTRVDELQAKLDSHEQEDKKMLKRLLDLEHQCEKLERYDEWQKTVIKQLGKQVDQNEKDDGKDWTELNKYNLAFMKQFKEVEGKVKTLEIWREHLRRVENEKAAGHPVPGRK